MTESRPKTVSVTLTSSWASLDDKVLERTHTLIRSRRLRDNDKQVAVMADDSLSVELPRDRVSLNDCVCNIDFQLGFTSATGRHAATVQLPDLVRLDRRCKDDDVTDIDDMLTDKDDVTGDSDDVTLSGQQLTMTSPTARRRR